LIKGEKNKNILRLIAQTKAMVCAIIFYNRSEERSTTLWDHLESVLKTDQLHPLFESV